MYAPQFWDDFLAIFKDFTYPLEASLIFGDIQMILPNFSRFHMRIWRDQLFELWSRFDHAKLKEILSFSQISRYERVWLI